MPGAPFISYLNLKFLIFFIKKNTYFLFFLLKNSEIIECSKHKLEFYKRDIEPLERSNILTISELNDFVRILIDS